MARIEANGVRRSCPAQAIRSRRQLALFLRRDRKLTRHRVERLAEFCHFVAAGYRYPRAQVSRSHIFRGQAQRPDAIGQPG